MKRFSIAMLVLLAAVAAGCTPTAPAPSPGPGPSVPGTQTTPVPTGTVQPSGIVVRVYFDRDEKMQPVLRSLPPGTTATLKGALEELLAGPTAAEKAAGLGTQVPAGTTLLGVNISGKTATVDLSSKFESGGGTLTMTNRLAQVVYTATQFSTVTSVKFKLNGKAVKVFGGEGIMIDKPQTRADYEYSTPAIFVDGPAWQGNVVKGLTAGGTANVFEASFHLQLRDSTGKLLVDKTVQASSGTGTRGIWSQTLSWDSGTPGTGELKVFADSPKDGSPIEVVTIPVIILP